MSDENKADADVFERITKVTFYENLKLIPSMCRFLSPYDEALYTESDMRLMFNLARYDGFIRGGVTTTDTAIDIRSTLGLIRGLEENAENYAKEIGADIKFPWSE